MEKGKRPFTFVEKSSRMDNHKPHTMTKSVEEKSRIRDVPERTARENGAGSGLAEWMAKTVSERPLIGYGSSRYEQKRWQASLRLTARRVEPRDNTSLAMLKLQGTFCVAPQGVNGVREVRAAAHGPRLRDKNRR